MLSPKSSILLIREYCNKCPVVWECLETGLEQDHIIGIWGGVFVPRSYTRTVRQDAINELKRKHRRMSRERDAA